MAPWRAQRAIAGHFDAILLDVMLPTRDGLRCFVRDVRPPRVRTPIILLTARTAEPDKILGLETGADDYVTKPYSPAELRARINAVLRRTSEALPDAFRFGDVEVDFGRREVRRAGAVVPSDAARISAARGRSSGTAAARSAANV